MPSSVDPWENGYISALQPFVEASGEASRGCVGMLLKWDDAQ